MKQERFEKLMRSIDPRFLEEAQQSGAARTAGESRGIEKEGAKKARRHSRLLQRTGVILACLCLVLAGTRYLMPETDTAQAATLQELESLGYVMDLPESAEDTSYYLVTGKTGEGTIAQAEFTRDGESYCYRILQDTQQTGLFEENTGDTDPQSWSGQACSITVADGSDTVQVSWYSPQSQTQWSLETTDSRQNAVNTAYSILTILGFEIGYAPAGAEQVCYDIVTVKALPEAREPQAVEGKSAAQLSFDLDGVRYVYRIASPDGVPDEIPDISETSAAYAERDTAAQISWCRTAAYWNEGAEGKIIWFDIAPGTVYSLTMDRAADDAALQAMANALYLPMQGDN